MTAAATMRQISRLLLPYFKGDADKVLEWLCTPNPLFGEMCPISLAIQGREDKLLKLVGSLLEGNLL